MIRECYSCGEEYDTSEVSIHRCEGEEQIRDALPPTKAVTFVTDVYYLFGLIPLWKVERMVDHCERPENR